MRERKHPPRVERIAAQHILGVRCDGHLAVKIVTIAVVRHVLRHSMRQALDGIDI